MCTFVRADTASLASLAMPRGLEIVSRNLAVAICEADAPCTVNAALCPLRGLPVHDSLLVCFFSELGVCEMMMVF